MDHRIDAKNWNAERGVFRTPHCDNCAGEFRRGYIATTVQGEQVVLCSQRCLDLLRHVWAPRRRVYPGADLLVSLAASLAIVAMVLL